MSRWRITGSGTSRSIRPARSSCKTTTACSGLRMSTFERYPGRIDRNAQVAMNGGIAIPRGVLCVWAVLLLATALSPSASAAEPTEPLPTSADLHKLFDDGQYQPLLAKLARVLQLKGN